MFYDVVAPTACHISYLSCLGYKCRLGYPCLIHGICFRTKFDMAGMFLKSLVQAAKITVIPLRKFTTTPFIQQPWKLGKLNHVAIVCPDLDKSVSLYRDILKAKVSEKQAVPEHGVTVVFVELGETKIELLHPLGEKSPIRNFLEKNINGGLHHICIEVDNIDEAMAHVNSHKIRTLSPKPTIGSHGKPIVFLHPKDSNGVLIELEQS